MEEGFEGRKRTCGQCSSSGSFPNSETVAELLQVLARSNATLDVRIGVRKVGSRAVGHSFVVKELGSDVGGRNEHGSDHVGERRRTVRNSQRPCRLIHTVGHLACIAQCTRAPGEWKCHHDGVCVAATSLAGAVQLAKVWHFQILHRMVVEGTARLAWHVECHERAINLDQDVVALNLID